MSGRQFLTVNPELRAQKEVQNIIESYSNSWDILAELCQNSVDSIKECEEENSDRELDHTITIEIKEDDKSIKISDSGSGFDPDNVPYLLAPSGTDKSGNALTIGEKGVGLTFCIFSSNEFHLDTKSKSGSYEGKINFARNWLSEDDPSSPPGIEDESSSDNPFPAEETGSTITLKNVEVPGEGEDIFTLSPDRMEYLLRTKTAIGNTKKRFGESDVDIDVNLILNNSHGEHERSIEYEYYYPDYFWDDDDVVDIEEIEESREAVRWDDERKQRELGDKAWKLEGTASISGRKIRYFGFFVHSRSDWEDIAYANNLYRGDDENIEPDVGPGIFVSTRGMPTGIRIDPPDRVGQAGYLPNFFLLLGYDGFTFDVGRKSIPGITQSRTLQPIAREKFDVFQSWKAILRETDTPSPKPPEIDEIEREEMLSQLESLGDLNFDEISYLKKPGGQEAAVVSIFHELIGAGVLEHYHGLQTGYKSRYDFWGQYRAHRDELGQDIREDIPTEDIDRTVVIEFKHEASQIIPDVNDNTKFFENIDIIVSWNIDEEKFESRGIQVEPIHPDEQFYVGTNYLLRWPTTAGLDTGRQKALIVLSRLIDDLKRDV